jgi:integrase
LKFCLAFSEPIPNKYGMKMPDSFPVAVKSGNSVVKIYRHENGKYVEFKVAFYVGDKRKLETFADYEKARRRADAINGSVADKDVEALTISREERILFRRTTDALAGLGIEIDAAAREYAEARRMLGQTSLLDAVRDYAKRHPANLKPMTVTALVDELIAAKRKDGLSAEYLKDLSVRLGVFREAFQSDVSAITVAQINEFLRSLDVGGRSRNNYRRAIGTLIKFAEKYGALLKGSLPLEEIDLAREEQFDVEIWTPAEMAKLLTAAQLSPVNLKPGFNRRYAANQGILPLLVLGAFAGIRTSKEIRRQKWSDINLQTGFIRVTGAKGGTAAKRLIPISDNLRKWLSVCQPTAETCCTFARPEDVLKRLAKRAGVSWKHNALRHSYASYRVAETQNVPQVALELGNSVKMVNRHYREIVTPEQAKSWFSITPEKLEKLNSLIKTD